MSFTSIVILIILTLVLVGIAQILRQYWDSYSQVTPEEEAYDKRVARLNQRQAHRISDRFLRRTVNDEDAWKMMVRRGKQLARQHMLPRDERPPRQRERPQREQPRRDRSRRQR